MIEKTEGGTLIMTGSAIPFYSWKVTGLRLELEEKFAGGYATFRHVARLLGIKGRMTPRVRSKVKELVAAKIEELRAIVEGGAE